MLMICCVERKKCTIRGAIWEERSNILLLGWWTQKTHNVFRIEAYFVYCDLWEPQRSRNDTTLEWEQQSYWRGETKQERMIEMPMTIEITISIYLGTQLWNLTRQMGSLGVHTTKSHVIDHMNWRPLLFPSSSSSVSSGSVWELPSLRDPLSFSTDQRVFFVSTLEFAVGFALAVQGPERVYFNHQLGSPPDSLTWRPLWTRFMLSPDKIISMTDHYVTADLERSDDSRRPGTRRPLRQHKSLDEENRYPWTCRLRWR